MSSLTPAQLHALVRKFGSPGSVLKATPEAISSTLRIENERATGVIEETRGVNVDREIEEAQRRGVRIITVDDSTYPERLKTIFDPPPVLYILGQSLPVDERLIAIVGSRRATLYGRLMANSLARDLARYGAAVVSGMARGIDTFAHRGTLEGGGRTIAVLGSGLDVVYPRENASLMKEIATTGTVISEFPLGTKPLKQNFPRRNRIIAGLSMGVLVVEAAAKSGALITADYALENGRDVFAVPGRADGRYSQGTNNLIKQGAKMVTDVRDILEEFPDSFDLQDESFDRQGGKRAEVALEGDESKVFEILDSQPRHVETITRELGMPISKAIATLMGLEMKGLIKQLRGKMFIKNIR